MACQIIAIDDSPTIQKVIKIAFSRYDISIQSAVSLEEALKLSVRHAPDLYILDAALSQSKTMATFKAGADKAGVPILLLMGSYDKVADKAIEALGIKHRLKKPFASHDIVTCVQNILGSKFPKDEDRSQETREDPLLGLPPLPPPPPPGAFKAKPEGLPPLPKLETRKKGQKAFPEMDGEDEPTLSSLTETKILPDMSPSELKRMIQDLWRSEGEAYIRGLVETYCETHFGPIAREIITKELARLSDERDRLLGDS